MTQLAMDLTQEERADLGHYETIIQAGLATFYGVGQALLSIRDRRLYRATHTSFEDYLRQRWKISRQYGNRLIAAALVVSNLASYGADPIPQVETIVSTLPTSEAQARPLAELEPGQQREVWQEVQAEAKEAGKPITAASVQAKVDQRGGKVKVTATLETTPPPSTPAEDFFAGMEEQKPSPAPTLGDLMDTRLSVTAWEQLQAVASNRGIQPCAALLALIAEAYEREVAVARRGIPRPGPGHTALQYGWDKYCCDCKEGDSPLPKIEIGLRLRSRLCPELELEVIGHEAEGGQSAWIIKRLEKEDDLLSDAEFVIPEEAVWEKFTPAEGAVR